MARTLRPAWLAFGITVVLVVFVAVTAYNVARDNLADEFANAQYTISLYTARHIKAKYDTAGLSLRMLAQPAAACPADRAGELFRGNQQVALTRLLLADSTTAFLAFDRAGHVAAQWPERAERPPDPLLAEAFAAAQQRQRPVPVLYRTAAGESRLLMVQPTQPTARGLRAVGLVLDLAPLLAQPITDNPAEILIVDPPTLTVLSATLPLPSQVNLRDLYATQSESLFKAIAESKGGKERNAFSRTGLGARQAEPYLIGVQGLDLAGRRVVVVAASPRKQLVERYLTTVARWIVVIGLVTLVGLVSFVGLLLQSHAAVEEERRRSGERSSLLKISHALLSERSLEEVLTRISDEAVALFRAEGATIALVDEPTDEIEFRWVSSRRPDLARQLQGLRMRRGEGVLGWVISRGQGVLVADVEQDERFHKAVDQLTGGRTSSLLCAPLIDQKGTVFGAIELVNTLDHAFQDSDLVLLQSLAVTASAAVERAVFLERQAQSERLQREMEIARTVQQGLLPRHWPQAPGFDFCGSSDPAREVGGDFYDFIPVSDRHLGVVIADVADKGLGAAMFMVMCRSLLYTCAHRELSPAKVLEALNSRILEVSTSDLFVTVFYGVLDLHTNHFTFTNAGHNPPFLFRGADQSVSTITVPGMALGVIEPLGLGEQTVALLPGDRLVLYTDGVTEAIDAGEEQFGKQRVEAILAGTAAATAQATVDAIRQAVAIHVADQPQFDDMTLAVVCALATSRDPSDWVQDARTRG